MDLPAYRKKAKGTPKNYDGGFSISFRKTDQINTQLYEKYKDNIEENECAFCLEDLNTESCVKPNECIHIFHKNCLNEWLSSHFKCPTCMRQISSRHITLLS